MIWGSIIGVIKGRLGVDTIAHMATLSGTSNRCHMFSTVVT